MYEKIKIPYYIYIHLTLYFILSQKGAWNCVAFIRPKYIALRAKNPSKSVTWALRKAIVSSVEEEDLKKRQERRRSSFLLDMKRRRASTSPTITSPTITPPTQQQNFHDSDNTKSLQEETKKREMIHSNGINETNDTQLKQEFDTDDDNVDSDDVNGCNEDEFVCLELANRTNHLNFSVSTSVLDEQTDQAGRNRWDNNRLPSPLNESR